MICKKPSRFKNIYILYLYILGLQMEQDFAENANLDKKICI